MYVSDDTLFFNSSTSVFLRHIFFNDLNRQHKNIFLNNAQDRNEVSEEDPLAKCVITKNDTSAVPADLWSSTGVIQDKDEGGTKQKHYPFTKYIQTRGVTFVATDNISNYFLEKVALTYQQLIPDIDMIMTMIQVIPQLIILILRHQRQQE